MKQVLLTFLAALSVSVMLFSAMAEGGTRKVGVYNNYYSPKSITVSKGTKVKWIWKEGTHNVVGKGWASPVKSKGATWSRKFKRKGRFPYVCTFHSGMNGVVRVK